MKLPDAKMILGFKIGALLLKAMKGDARGAAMEVLDDFNSSDKKDVLLDRLAHFLMDRYGAVEVDIGSTEEGLELTIIGGENVLVKLSEDVEDLIQKTKMFIPEDSVRDKFMELVQIEEADDKVTLKLKIEDEIVNDRLKEVL